MADVMLVFGGIFLIMTIIGGMRMKREVTDAGCPEDVYNVKMNKIWYTGLLFLWGIVTAVGAVLVAVKYM